MSFPRSALNKNKNNKSAAFVVCLLILSMFLPSISYPAKPTFLFFKDAYTLQDIQDISTDEEQREFKVRVIDRNRKGAPEDVAERIEWAVDNEEVIIDTFLGTDGFSHIKMVPIEGGDFTLSATFDGQYKNKTVVFGKLYSLSDDGVEIINNGAKANGVATNQLKVTVLDQDNQLAAGAEVKWQLIDNNINAILSQGSTVTSVKGEAFIDVTAEKPGHVTVAVDMTGLVYKADNTTNKITFSELFETEKVGFKRLDVNRSLAKGDGEDAIEASITLADGLNPDNVEISWAIKGWRDRLSTDKASSKNKLVATFTQNYAGKAIIEATVTARNGAQGDRVKKIERKTQTVTFKNVNRITSLNVANSQKQGNKLKEVEANGVDAISVFAQLNHPVGNRTIAWRLEDNTANALLSNNTTTTNDKGLASVEVMATQAGSTTVVAQFIDKFGEPHGGRVRFSLHQAFKKTYNTGIHSIKKDKVAAKAGDSQGIEVSLFVDIGDGVTPSVNRPVVWMLKDNTIDARLEPERVLTDDKGYARTTVFAEEPGKVVVIGMVELESGLANDGPRYETA